KQEAWRRPGPGRGQLLHRCEARRRQRRIGLSEAQARRRVDIAVADENQFHGVVTGTGAGSLAFSGPATGGECSKVKGQSYGLRPARRLPQESVRPERRREAPKSKGLVQPLRL